MSKKKFLVVIGVVLLAAALLSAWYFGVKQPAMAAATGDAKTVTLHITHTDGSERTLELTTEQAYLSEALEEASLLVAEDQGYGLTIVALDGEEALIANNASWVFNVNGEPGAMNVGETPVQDGDVYDFYVLTW